MSDRVLLVSDKVFLVSDRLFRSRLCVRVGCSVVGKGRFYKKKKVVSGTLFAYESTSSWFGNSFVWFVLVSDRVLLVSDKLFLPSCQIA